MGKSTYRNNRTYRLMSLSNGGMGSEKAPSKNNRSHERSDEEALCLLGKAVYMWERGQEGTGGSRTHTSYETNRGEGMRVVINPRIRSCISLRAKPCRAAQRLLPGLILLLLGLMYNLVFLDRSLIFIISWSSIINRHMHIL